METSTAETSDTRPDIVAGPVGRRLFVLVRFVVYGLAATVGSLAVATGLGTYLDHAGGVGQPVPSLFGVVVALGIGWTLLLIALSGAVACGIGRGAS